MTDTTLYARVNLNTTPYAIESIGPLPANLAGLRHSSLANLSWADPALGYAGIGYWAVVDAPEACEDPWEEPGPAGFPQLDAPAFLVTRTIPAVPRPLADVKADLKARVRALRKQHEEAGTSFGGFPLRTDQTTQGKLNGAIKLLEEEVAKAAADPGHTPLAAIEWEGLPDVWATLDLATLKEAGRAVGRHVQACFTRSRLLGQQIDACSTLAELRALDLEAGWPG